MVSGALLITSQVLTTFCHCCQRSHLEKTNAALKLRGQAMAQWPRFRMWTQKCSVLTPCVLCSLYITDHLGGIRRSMAFIWAICSEIIFAGNKRRTELWSWIVHFWFSSFLSLITLGRQFMLMFSFYSFCERLTYRVQTNLCCTELLAQEIFYLCVSCGQICFWRRILNTFIWEIRE